MTIAQRALTQDQSKIVFLSALGGALEFYDFVIYAIFAPVISQVFFPKTNALASLMGVYAIFAIGYLIRPLGGVVFSHFGDKYGRKQTFVCSVMLMAIPTFLIGLLPSSNSVGLVASCLLILLRLLQGLSIGGEIPGAITFTCEHVSNRYRGLTCGILFASFDVGIILGSCISLLLYTWLTHEQILAWGWRIPFLFGGLLGVVSFYLRKKMTESPLFISFQHASAREKMPLMEALTEHWPAILQGICITWLGSVVINLLFLYMPTYLTTILSYPNTQVALYNTLNILLHGFALIAISWLSDSIGRRPILMAGALGFVLLSYLLFACLAQQTTGNLIAGMLMISLLGSCMIYPCVLVELFPTSIRYTGIAISYNVGFAVFGGLTPLIVTYLIKSTDNILAPSFYLILSAAFCLITALTIKSKHKTTLA